MPSATPIFSMAIPAYNEAALLPRLLDSIDIARANYAGGADKIEVIIGNNASTDATAEIARAHGAIVVDVAKRTIAAARNGASSVARGEFLCFIDADSIVHPDTFNQIEHVLRSGRCAVGATGVKMERMSPGIAVTWAFLMVLVYAFGVDTGVVFCRRGDFTAIGGYREDVIVAEDVDFLMRLKRLGRSRGQRFLRTPGARAITSTRKFDRHGDWHYLRDLLLLFPLRLLISRSAARRFALKYWYEDR
jgi:glycosyltransferase involved in cell wall biosynthesis